MLDTSFCSDSSMTAAGSQQVEDRAAADAETASNPRSASHGRGDRSPAGQTPIPCPSKQDLQRHFRFLFRYGQIALDYLLDRQLLQRPTADGLQAMRELHLHCDADILTFVQRNQIVQSIFDLNFRYDYHPETAYLSSRIFDRFSQKVPTMKSVCGLLGLVCFWIASKMNEARQPRLSDLLILAGPSFKRDDILQLEGIVLRELDWDLYMPTPHSFIHRLVDAMDFLKRDSKRMQDIILYAELFANLCSFEYSMLKYAPSEVALGSILRAFEQTERAPICLEAWCDYFEKTFRASPSAIYECSCDVASLYRKYFPAMTVNDCRMRTQSPISVLASSQHNCHF